MAEKPILITGGAGFIGINLAHRLLSSKQSVLLFDNLSRPGVQNNLKWLVRKYGRLVQFVEADVLDVDAISMAVRGSSQVFHFAAQVAVTGSVRDTVADFEINARGTLNILEALRRTREAPPLLFTSTNKVYGSLKHVELFVSSKRFQPQDPKVLKHGFDETTPLDFQTPYGCSKGSADQYVLDYARTFGLRTTVFRLSCIYGPHQLGNEDQGWIAHLAKCAIQGTPITIYGDGKQVRDALFVEDLVDALLAVRTNVNQIAGEVFNIGGGPSNSLSVLELIDTLKILKRSNSVTLNFRDERTGDQRYYVSDLQRFQAATQWKPQVNVRVGVGRLYRFLERSLSS